MINMLLKIFLWLALLCCFILMSVLCGDYFEWLRWQQGLFFLGLIITALLAQWSWRRWKLKRYLKSLSASKVLNFNAEHAFHEGLHLFKQNQPLSERTLSNKNWFIGIAFDGMDSVDEKESVLLANNQVNIEIRLVKLDNAFILQFYFKSRLLLERELELYQRYLAVFREKFKAAIKGFLYFVNANAFEQHDALSLTTFNDNVQKIIIKTVDISQTHYPINLILTDINEVSGYPDFLIRLPRKFKTMLLGWQASTFEFYNSEDWRERQWLTQWLVRAEYAFANNLNIRSVEAYLFLTHIQRQAANIQILFDQVSDATDIAVAGIYWVESLKKLSALHVKSFTNCLFNKQLVTGIQPQLTLVAQHNKISRITTLRATYWCVMAAVFLYACYAFFQEKHVILAQVATLPKKIFFYYDIQRDLASISIYKTIISQLDEDFVNNHFRFMPFHAGFDELRANYARTFSCYFHTYILKQVDNDLIQIIQTSDFQTDPVLRGKIIFHVMNRLNLLHAKIHHIPLDGLAGPNLWLKNTTLLSSNPHYSFADLYVTYVAENTDNQALQTEYTQLMKIALLLNLAQDDFHWLPAYLNTQSDIAPLTLNSLWGGSRIVQLDNASIAPAYTFDGSQAITAFWVNFKQAFAVIFANAVTQQMTFEQWYQQLRFTCWARFLSEFPQGYLTLNDMGEWNQVYVKMASGQNISQLFLELITAQFSDELTQKVRLLASEPAWLVLTNKVTTVLNAGVNQSNITTVKDKLLSLKALIQFAKERDNHVSPEQQAEAYYFNSYNEKGLAASTFYQYFQTLTKLYVPVMLSQAAFENSKAIYVGGNQPFTAAVTIEQAMEQQFNTVNLDNIIFWNIYRVPLEFYLRYVNYLSATYINQAWQNEVLTKLQNTPEFFMTDLMFGESGLFWTFYNKYLSDYFNVNVGTVLPKTYFAVAYPFNDDFYRLLLSASARYSMLKQQNLYKKYFSSEAASPPMLPPLPPLSAPDATAEMSVNPVATIMALPPTLNHEATLQPQQITLLAECTKGNFDLTNYNFPIQKPLPMPLSDCTNVSVRFYFGEFYLEKNYPGATGFLDFLTRINNNTLNFSAQDFPDHALALKHYHINNITLHYQLSGLSSMLEQYKAYLKMQTNFSQQQKNYTSIMDLPNTIVYSDALDKTSLKHDLSNSL